MGIWMCLFVQLQVGLFPSIGTFVLLNSSFSKDESSYSVSPVASILVAVSEVYNT